MALSDTGGGWDDHRASYDAMLASMLDDLTGSDRRHLIGLLQRIGV